MDTREKILALSEVGPLLQDGRWVIAVGQFDPMTAVQANRLSELRKAGDKLLAVVLESPTALLPNLARAVLIASLRDVNAVAVAEQETWRSAIPRAARLLIVEDAQGEECRSADFVRYVVGRQAAASEGGRG